MGMILEEDYYVKACVYLMVLIRLVKWPIKIPSMEGKISRNIFIIMITKFTWTNNLILKSY